MRIACDENSPSLVSGPVVTAKMQPVFQSAAAQPLATVGGVQPVQSREDDRLSLLREARQQRQDEHERERQRTQHLKSTLAEAVNASRERFNASTATRGPTHDLNGNMARLVNFRSAAAAVSSADVSYTVSGDVVQRVDSYTPCTTSSAGVPARQMSSGAAGQASPVTWASGAEGAAAASPRNRPGLQRDRGGTRSGGVGCSSAVRLEASDRSLSPQRTVTRAGTLVDRNARSAERTRTDRSLSPSGTRPGVRASFLQDTASSAQKRAGGSRGFHRTQSAGPRLAERQSRESPSVVASPATSALKSRPPPASTPRGLAASRPGGARSPGSGSAGTLHATPVAAVPTAQAHAVTRQRSAGSSLAATGKTPRGPSKAASQTPRPSTPNSARPLRSGDSSSSSSLGATGLASSGSRISGQDTNSPKRSRNPPLSARAVPSAQTGPRKRPGVESSPGTSSPSRGAAGGGESSWVGGWSQSGSAVRVMATPIATVPALPSNRTPAAATESRGSGGAVLAELNTSERLQSSAEVSQPAATQKPLPLSSVEVVAAKPRPAPRDTRRPDLGAVSCRLPAEAGRRREADLQTACENGDSYSAADEDSVCLEMQGEASGEAVCEPVMEVEEEPLDAPPASAPADVHAAAVEQQGLTHQAMVVAMGGSMQEPGAFLSTLAEGGFLSPIREVAEGGLTPTPTAAREVRELQEAHPAEAHSRSAPPVVAPMGQLDLAVEDEEESVEVAGTADAADQLPTSKERYLQLRERFLAKS